MFLSCVDLIQCVPELRNLILRYADLNHPVSS